MVLRNRKKISKLSMTDYHYLPFFLLIILWVVQTIGLIPKGFVPDKFQTDRHPILGQNLILHMFYVLRKLCLKGIDRPFGRGVESRLI